MKCFMQGMRRSGTTIIFDVLSRDARLDLWYEPLSLGKEGALGGGSGMQEVDLMKKVRAAREEFIARYDQRRLTHEDLNCGAPTEPKREIKRKFPRHIRDYLDFLINRSEHTVCKFTRVYRKVEELKRLRPDAKLILLLRHPQDVVVSYMYGKDQRHQKDFPDREAFFSYAAKVNPWSSYKLLKRIAKKEKRPELLELPCWMRYLALWRYTSDQTFAGGRKHFGKAFTVLRHEDLCARPREEVERVYAHLGLEPCAEAVTWAEEKVRARRKECYADDARWAQAYERLGLVESMERLGYAPGNV
ncbi:MAG: sulfotransferase [Planctomycetes bacterium]|nr:sulfotransferase [Planctomycetota bacterium]